jgi:hypothetical protein
MFGRLEQHVVAGSDRGDQRDQGQVHRIIPWRHHADHADRLAPHLCACRPQAPADADAARFHPATQVAAQVVDLGDHRHRIGEQRLVRRAVAEVGLDRRDHGVAAGLECLAQASEVVEALPCVRPLPLPCGAQTIEAGAQIGDGGAGGIHRTTIRRRMGFVGAHLGALGFPGKAPSRPGALLRTVRIRA